MIIVSSEEIGVLPITILLFFGKPRGPFDFLVKLWVCLTWYLSVAQPCCVCNFLCDYGAIYLSPNLLVINA